MEPPTYLSKAMRKWWREVERECVLESHHFKLLEMACQSYDRWEEAREALEEAGSLTYSDRFDQPKARPELQIERDSRLSFARLTRELGLDAAGVEVPRPVPLRANMRGGNHAG